jgi:putative alpha-1,2-mannosidase
VNTQEIIIALDAEIARLQHAPVSGTVDPEDFGSSFSHKNESAHPGYYQIYLERYHINAEFTTTLRTGFHRYTYDDNHQPKKLVVNLAVSDEKIRDWNIEQEGDNAFSGYQTVSEKVFLCCLQLPDQRN